ncbi:MAG TPA: hypothetical protein VFG23_00590 [Polyangia bacterium]|nr:hypothetical protein [Polyangia bacterium]
MRSAEKKTAPRTVNLIMALVRSILRFAVANGRLAASPTDRLGRGKLMLPVEKAKLAPPIERADDVERLLATLRDMGDELRRPDLHPLFALLALLVYTGLAAAKRSASDGQTWTSNAA